MHKREWVLLKDSEQMCIGKANTQTCHKNVRKLLQRRRGNQSREQQEMNTSLQSPCISRTIPYILYFFKSP